MKNEKKPNRLLRVDPDVADILNVHPRTVYRLVATGQLQALRVRGALRVPQSGLDDYIQRQLQIFKLEVGFSDCGDKD